METIYSLTIVVLVFSIGYVIRKYSKYCPRETKW